MLLRNSIRNNCKNLCLHPKPFKITIKPNSYLPSIFRRGPVKPSNPNFLNINLTKRITNLLVISKFNQNWQQQFPPLQLWHEVEIIFLSDITFLLWLRKYVNPNFWQYQSYRNNEKFNCYLEIQSEIAEIISICTLNPLKLP